MEQINAISIPFFKFKANIELQNEILGIVKELNYKSATNQENGFISENFYHKKLFEFFDSSIKEFKKIYFVDDVDFPIVDCWVNKYTGLNNLNKHNHVNSAICGLYYVTSHDKNLSTIFEAENPWSLYGNTKGIGLSLNKTNNQPLIGEVIPESGTLILFPPALYHYMKPIKLLNVQRYTIAFNTFPSGDISLNRTKVLSVKTISVEDKFGK